MKKTPRELLLARHKAVTSKLDAIRHRVVEGLNQKTTPVPSTRRGAAALSAWLEILRAEVFLPTRRAWVGLAAVWLVIAFFRFTAPEAAPLVTDHTPVPALPLLMALEKPDIPEAVRGKQSPRVNETPPRPRREGRALNVQRFASRAAEPAFTSF